MDPKPSANVMQNLKKMGPAICELFGAWRPKQQYFVIKTAAGPPFWILQKIKIDGHKPYTKFQLHAKFQENQSGHLWGLGDNT